MMVVERTEQVDFYGPYTIAEIGLLLNAEDHPVIDFSGDCHSAYAKVLEWADPEDRI